MPSNDDYKELWNNTDQTYKTVDGVLCRKFANRTDATKYILIPFAGKCNETSLGDVNKYHHIGHQRADRIWLISWRLESPLLVTFFTISPDISAVLSVR